MTERDKKSIVSALKVLAISVFCVACIGIYLLFCFLLAADSLNYGEYGYMARLFLPPFLLHLPLCLHLHCSAKQAKSKE